MAGKESVGRFYWQNDTGTLEPKQRARLADIEPYYTDTVIDSILIPIITKSEPNMHIRPERLSLRALDWLVTNYAKKKPVVYKIAPPNHPTIPVNIHNDYKSWLNNHKRRNFDMFRRRKRIFFEHRDATSGNMLTHETTVGQLNFFFWAARYGVLDYARANILAIEADHTISTKRNATAEPDNTVTDELGENPEPPSITNKPSTPTPAALACSHANKSIDVPSAVTLPSALTLPAKRLVSDVGGAHRLSKKQKPLIKTRDAKNTVGIIRRRRRELSRAPHSKCFVYSMKLDVVFDKEPE